jgi:hypothetical protein
MNYRVRIYSFNQLNFFLGEEGFFRLVNLLTLHQLKASLANDYLVPYLFFIWFRLHNDIILLKSYSINPLSFPYDIMTMVNIMNIDTISWEHILCISKHFLLSTFRQIFFQKDCLISYIVILISNPFFFFFFFCRTSPRAQNHEEIQRQTIIGLPIFTAS